MNEAHTADHNATHEDSEESETIKIVNLNEIFASQMNKNGLTVEAVPIGTLNLEREEYYNNDISLKSEVYYQSWLYQDKRQGNKHDSDYPKILTN